MILYGAGGHSKVVCSCLEENNIDIFGVFDDNPDCKVYEGIKVLGKYNPLLLSDEKIIITIGDNLTRRKVSEIVKHQYGFIFHPSALIDRMTKIGTDTVIFHKSVVQRGTEIGSHVIINTCASVDHDCTIGDYSHIAPNATICGDVQIGEGTLVGAGSVIKPGIKVGKWCIIGIGAVILNNIPDYSMVVGNPGRIIRQNLII